MLSALSGGRATRETRTRAVCAGWGSGPALRTASTVSVAPTGRLGRERRVCGRAGELAAEPSYPEQRIGPPTPASRRLLSAGDEQGAPPAHLPTPEWKGESIFRAYGGVAVLSWVAMPSGFGEESEVVLSLISGTLDQPAGEAGTGSALPGGRGCSPAGASRRAPGMLRAHRMLARRLARTNVDSFSLMTEIFSPLSQEEKYC